MGAYAGLLGVIGGSAYFGLGELVLDAEAEELRLQLRLVQRVGTDARLPNVSAIVVCV